MGLVFSATQSFARVELYIDRGDKAENKFAFDELLKGKSQIEADYGGALVWERLDNKRASRIKAEVPGDVFDRDQWDVMIQFMSDSMVRLEQALKGPLKKVGQKLKALPETGQSTEV